MAKKYMIYVNVNMSIRKRKRSSEEPFISKAIVNVRETGEYRHQFNVRKVQPSKKIVREMGTERWYSMKKRDLISLITLDILVKRIQRLFKTKGGNIKRRNLLTNGLDEYVCPITLEKINDIPIKDRYLHSNYWFDRKSLSGFMRSTCDFIHPVTRKEFTEYDIINIDPNLILIYKHRDSIRSSIVSQITNVQCIENELESIFKEMIETACLSITRNDFNVDLSFSEAHFRESFNDLKRLDRGRCILVLKSLPDLINGDDYVARHIPKRRRIILNQIVKEYISIA